MRFPLRRLLPILLSGAGAFSTAASADTTYLVQDLGSRVMEEWVDQRPPVHAVADGVAYFYRSDGLHGRELWRSDGTTLGTYMIRDVCPGLCGSESFSDADTIEAVGALVYFSGHDGVRGSELWVTDGTAAGTRMVADLRPGPLSSLPYDFASAAGLLYFTADDGVLGRELGRSDGTAAGTYLVDVAAGPGGSSILLIEPSPTGLFLYRSGLVGGLWRSDGTAAGTELVLSGIEIPVSGWHKNAAFRTLSNGVLVFNGCSQSNPTSDCEPWRSDGTAAGTFRLADLSPGNGSSQPSGFVLMGNEIWFVASVPLGRPLFRTDGTVAGTAPIPTPSGLFLSSAGEAHEGRLFLAGTDEVVGAELWVSDGAGTQLVVDLRPGPDGALAPVPFQTPFLASLGSSLLFLADDGSGIGLWSTDGSAAGTERLTDFDLAPGEPFRFDDQASVPALRAGGRLVLPLWKDDVGLEVWTSDASAAGTQPILTTATQRSAFTESVRWTFTLPPTRCAAPLRHGLVVATYDTAFSTGSFHYLDGVPQGAARLGAAFDEYTRHPECAANGGEVLALGGPNSGTGVLRTRGHENDAELVLFVGAEPSSHPFFERFGNRLAFAIEKLLYLAPEGGDLGSYSTWDTEEIQGMLRAAEQRLFFGGGHRGLAALEGETLTTLVAPPPPTGGDPNLDDLESSASRAYFSLATAADGAELWTSDGTPGGTRLVRELRSGAASPFRPREVWERVNALPEPRIAGLGDGRAVFAADDGVHGNELWITDGTEAGTVLLADVVPGPDGSWPRRLTSFGSTVVFAAEDPKHGLELWRTDGTPAGTALLRDLVVGPGSSVPEDLSVQDGLLYFSAWTPAHGREAWRSDGSPAGTYRITDLVPGARSSNPNRFLRSGELLFFVANDEVHGREVWALAPDGSFPLFLDGFESGSTDRWSAAVP